ncbi:ATP-binding protein [Arthrobacter zhaoguopingii]|uniref:ATP-binding protein n=1 Tax=Arthrobacter zhaoguopingii TaxID=2681491 RepID=UPI00135C1EBD|nr:ATP-binding protein [Arthrobacter zhaoguopingii]
MESMRAVGYTLETAVADIIDNSITADATEVDLIFAAQPEPHVALVDNGSGMSAAVARNAMRLAGLNSRDHRAANDLGRFGLGLKTASISQCRDLVVVTKQDGVLSGYRWDLDYLMETKSWSLLELSEDECRALPGFSALDKHESGTLVLWRKLDQLEATVGDLEAGLNAHMVGVRKHLALVFHRFLAGEHGKKLAIAINFRPIEGADPLLQNHKATLPGPIEKIDVEGEMIELRPYTLPHLNKLSTADRERAQVEGSMRDSQGFYIYRQKRLVIWGTWFRIAPKQELGKLARVRVDVPNSLDHLWALDIKKAQAVPPPSIQRRLRQVATNIIAPSRRVHEYRGRRTNDGKQARLWNVYDDRNSFRYEINRDHPAVIALATQPVGGGESVDALLRLLERSFPVDDVYNRMGQDQTQLDSKTPDDELALLASSLWESLQGTLTAEVFVESMANSEPFDSNPKSRRILQETVKENV